MPQSFLHPLFKVCLIGKDLIVGIHIGISGNAEYDLFFYRVRIKYAFCILLYDVFRPYAAGLRPRQIKLCATAFFLNIILLGLLFLGPDAIASNIAPDMADEAGRIVNYRWICFLPFGSLILTNMASRAIKKDEALVRSADRLR